MIPPTLRSLVEKQPGEYWRAKHAEAKSAIEELGISLESEFAEFYLAYKVTSFHSEVSYVGLVDVAEPTRQMRGTAQFAREVWELPDEFVCISDCQGEGGYLYAKTSGRVFDFELATREDFLAGRRPTQWSGFFQFMTWYLSEGNSEKGG